MYKTFVTIPKAVPEKLCDEMVKESSEYTEHLAGVMWKKEADLKKDRNSKVRWYPLDHWIVPKLCEIASEVNKQDYLFNVTNLQCPQFTEYTKGQHYQWHRDIYPPEPNGPYPGLVRKLSMIVQLSKPENYVGGDLRFNLRGLDGVNSDSVMSPPPEFKLQGSLVIFPSFLWHKVEPITSGKRYSLVMWTLGENWK